MSVLEEEISLFISNLSEVEQLYETTFIARFKNIVFLCSGNGKNEKLFIEELKKYHYLGDTKFVFVDDIYTGNSVEEMSIKRDFPTAIFLNNIPVYRVSALYIAINPQIEVSFNLNISEKVLFQLANKKEQDMKLMKELGEIHIFRTDINIWKYMYGNYTDFEKKN